MFITAKDRAAQMTMDFMGDIGNLAIAKQVAKRAAYLIGIEITKSSAASNDADYWNAVIAEIDLIQLV
jgi:hypothetical protein